jgi:hypothetical protein
MLAKDQEDPAFSHMRALFDKPPLIKGENIEHYWRLWAAFEDDIKPKNWRQWMMVNDLTVKYWEQLRLRRYSPALIEGACIEALEILLRPFIRSTAEMKDVTRPTTEKKVVTRPTPEMNDVTSDIARFFYVGIGNTKKKAIMFVAECGITLDQIFALAMQMRGSGLLILDRMDGNRENACRALRKEIERRAAASESPPDHNPDDENQEP